MGEVIGVQPEDFTGTTSMEPDNRLTADDKLVLKTMEADILRAQIQVQQTQAAAKDAISRLDQFAKDLLEKYERDPKEWTLSLEKLEFVARQK
jgi:hypothetical protein